MSTPPVNTDDAPLLRVLKGNPTEEEIAAVLAVLTANAASTPTRPPVSGWSAYWRTMKAPLRAGPGAWQSSGRPG